MTGGTMNYYPAILIGIGLTVLIAGLIADGDLRQRRGRTFVVMSYLIMLAGGLYWEWLA
jgi:hypothetical protein